MQIPDKLLQFNSKKSLILVTGAHHYLVYRASNGTIEKVHEDRIDEATYSDNEGMFKSSAAEGAFGSVLESKKDEATKKLSKSLSEKSFDLLQQEGVDSIYLFVSPQIKSDLENDLHEDVKKKIIATYSGNYTKQEPFALLEMIEKDPEGRE